MASRIRSWVGREGNRGGTRMKRPPNFPPVIRIRADILVRYRIPVRGQRSSGWRSECRFPEAEGSWIAVRQACRLI